MGFKLIIDSMGNEAFSNGNHTYEVARILRGAAARVDGGDTYGNCFDLNGNKVGEWSLDYEPEDEEDGDPKDH